MERRDAERDPAPDFSLLAAGSGRRISLRSSEGRGLVLIFHLQGTAPTAREINRSVRERYPSPEEVLIASVIDLSIVPPEYVLICPDYGGFVSRRYSARNTGRTAVITVVDRGSKVIGSYEGERPVEAVLGMLDGA